MKKLLRYFIYLMLFIIVIYGFVFLGKKDYSSKITDAEKFSKEYTNIPSDNPFIYVKGYQVLDIMKNKTGIILMGFSQNEWMQSYVNNFYDVLKENNIKKVYYYDLREDRAKKTKNFMAIEDLLVDYLKLNDEGKETLNTPCILFISNGKILNYDDETSLYTKNMTPSTYWNEQKIAEFKDKINIYLGGDTYNEQ